MDIHYVYVISAVENDVPVAPCKIGITSKLSSRLASIQTGSPKKLEIISAIPIPTRDIVQAIEQCLHWQFDDFRLHGEWFNLCPVDAAIGACVIAREAFMFIVPDETKAYAALDKLGITAEIARCFEFVERCNLAGLPLDSKFMKDATPAPPDATLN